MWSHVILYNSTCHTFFIRSRIEKTEKHIFDKISWLTTEIYELFHFLFEKIVHKHYIHIIFSAFYSISHSFLLLLFPNSVATAVVWGRILSKKVLLKLSSKVKLRNFDYWYEDDSDSTTPWCVQPLLASCISYGVGYCFIRINW